MSHAPIAFASRPVCGYLSLTSGDGVKSLAEAQWYWKLGDEEQTTAPKGMTSWSMRVVSGSCNIGPAGFALAASNLAQRGVPLATNEGTGDSRGSSVEHWFVATDSSAVLVILGTMGGPS